MGIMDIKEIRNIFITFTAAAAVLTGLALGSGTEVAEATPKVSKTVTVTPSGDKSGCSDRNAIAGYTEDGGYHIILKKGTYYVNGQLRLNSNTYLEAEGAKIVEVQNGSRLLTQPYDRDGYKAKKGYGSIHDVTINGGTWVGTKKFADSNVNVKNGQKTGANVINFWHAKNVTIKNLTVYNAVNAHLIELCGVKNAKILNCHIGCYKDSSGKLKKGYSTGDVYRGAIQLDYCSRSGNRHSEPFDGTTCNGVRIGGNYIWYRTAVQIANDSSKTTKNVQVKNNTLRCRYTWTSVSMRKAAGFKASENKTLKY